MATKNTPKTPAVTPNPEPAAPERSPEEAAAFGKAIADTLFPEPNLDPGLAPTPEPAPEPTPEPKAAKTPVEKPAEAPNPEPKVTEPPTPEPTPEPKAVEKPATPPAETPKADPAPPAPPLSADDVAEQVLKRLDARPAPTPAPAPVNPGVEDIPDSFTNDEYRQIYAVLARDPRYADVGKELEGFLVREQRYMRAWKMANPGKPFNPHDQQHEDWYSKNAPDVAVEDLKRAETIFQAERAAELRTEAKLREFDEQRRVNEARAQAGVVANQAVSRLLEVIDPELAKKPGLSVAKIEEEDPLLGAELAQHVPALSRFSQVGTLMAASERAFKPDDPAHQEWAGNIYAIEQDLARQDPNSLVYQGRKFLPLAQFQALDDTQRGRYWTLLREPTIAAYCMASSMGRSIRQRVDKTLAVLKKRYGMPATVETKPAAAPEPEPAKPAPAAAAEPVKPAPPSLASRSDKEPAAGAVAEGSTEFAETVAKELWA